LLGATVTHILGGAASGIAPAAAVGTNNASQPTDIYVDSLLRADTPAAGGTANVTAAPSGGSDVRETRAELGRLMAPTLRKGGDLAANDRAYVAKIVSARTGLSQADADKRVSDTIAQAKKATDDARKATASLMLWLAGSMLAGAVASMLGATEGGVLRDSKWYEPGWRARDVRNH
jgi:hypothetical protein